jgi:hypothetical protein
MRDQTCNALTHHTADAVSRRSSLAALSAAALAAGLLGSTITEAKDDQAKKAKKKARKRCRNQEGQCEGAVQAFCQALDLLPESVRSEGIPDCVPRFSVCCPFFSTCNAEAGVRCLLDAFIFKAV